MASSGYGAPMPSPVASKTATCDHYFAPGQSQAIDINVQKANERDGQQQQQQQQQRHQSQYPPLAPQQHTQFASQQTQWQTQSHGQFGNTSELSVQQLPARTNSDCSSSSETSVHLRNSTLLAEAVERAQMDVAMRDMDELSL